MKTAVIYKSFFGVTKKYATWLADELKADLMTFREAKNINNYDQLIILSGTYASWMPMTAFLKKNWDKLNGKRVVAVSVGISPDNDPYTEKTLNKIPENIRKEIKIVRLPGLMFGKAIPETGEVKKENIEKIKKLL